MKKELDEAIQRELEKKARYQEKLEELQRKINKCDANLKKYQHIKNEQQLNNISKVLERSGITIDEIMVALVNKDLLSLQEKMEENIDMISEAK